MMKLLLAALLLILPLWAQAAPEPPWNGGFNCSGTITTGGTAQLLVQSNGAAFPRVLHGYQIQNLSTDALAFSEFTTTPATMTNGSWTLNAATASTAGGSYNSPAGYSPSTPIFIIGATTGDKFTCSAW